MSTLLEVLDKDRQPSQAPLSVQIAAK